MQKGAPIMKKDTLSMRKGTLSHATRYIKHENSFLATRLQS